MNEHDNELKQALAENGPFDPAKAAESRQLIVADFGAKLRRVERTMWVYLGICVCVILVAANGFKSASGTREWILYAIVFLVGFESTILIKLWYWVANTKVTLMKEMKLLRLSQAARDPADVHGSTVPRAGLSRWERMGWITTMVVGAILAAGLLAPTAGVFRAGLTNETYVTLKADGSGTVIGQWRLRNDSTMPLVSLDFDAPAADQIRWIDEEGRPMSATATVRDGRKHYTIELPKPLMPGEWLTTTRIARSPRLAEKQEDGRWVYRFDESYGSLANDFKVVVRLPDERLGPANLSGKGSYEHISLMGQEALADGRRDRNEAFQFTVTYRTRAQRDANPNADSPTKPDGKQTTK